MKGIIFNIAEKFIADRFGEEKLEQILSACELETIEPFVGPGTYPDSDLMEIVHTAAEKVGLPMPEFMKQMGHFTFFKLAERYPNFVAPYSNPKDFLMTVDNVIHVEVRKLYRDTQLPIFQYSEPSENELVITYYSKRKMYDLMEGLINGVAEHFNTRIEQRHSRYEKDGHEFYDYHLIFS